MTISDGKKGFTGIIKESVAKNEDIVITKRGRPVAALLPYKEYTDPRKLRTYLKMLEISTKMHKTGIKAKDGSIKERTRREEDVTIVIDSGVLLKACFPDEEGHTEAQSLISDYARGNITSHAPTLITYEIIIVVLSRIYNISLIWFNRSMEQLGLT